MCIVQIYNGHLDQDCEIAIDLKYWIGVMQDCVIFMCALELCINWNVHEKALFLTNLIIKLFMLLLNYIEC